MRRSLSFVGNNLQDVAKFDYKDNSIKVNEHNISSPSANIFNQDNNSEKKETNNGVFYI
jgi:hypothetical protein